MSNVSTPSPKVRQGGSSQRQPSDADSPILYQSHVLCTSILKQSCTLKATANTTLSICWDKVG